MKKILIICLITLGISSCGENFLELYPLDKSTTGSFYKTETDFTQALNGTYGPLRHLYGVENRLYVLTEQRADNVHYTYYAPDRGGSAVVNEPISNFFNLNGLNGRVNGVWERLYIGIARANTLLGHVDEAPEFSAGFMDEIVGQAKFLRAFYYFHLVQLFGDVPLHLTEVTSPEESFLARTPVNDVYAAIINDVTEAIRLLPEVSYKDGKQSGRATEGAARMLYAYVLMTKPDRDYVEAEKQLRAVLAMNYALEPDYATVFNPLFKNGKESIFEIQYLAGDVGTQNAVIYDFLPRAGDHTLITGVTGGANDLDGGWMVPTQAMIDSYESGDLRRDKSIAIAVGIGDPTGLMIPQAVLSPGDPGVADYAIARAFTKKFLHEFTKQKNTNDNWPVYRLADTYLLLAECLVLQNRGNEASTYVAMVRNRAGLQTTPATITIDDLLMERKHELAFEGHRWYDLLRTGKALEIMNAFGIYIKALDINLIPETYDIKPEYLLYPIPYSDIQLNDKLIQNPGYAN